MCFSQMFCNLCWRAGAFGCTPALIRRANVAVRGFDPWGRVGGLAISRVNKKNFFFVFFFISNAFIHEKVKQVQWSYSCSFHIFWPRLKLNPFEHRKINFRSQTYSKFQKKMNEELMKWNENFERENPKLIRVALVVWCKIS